MVAEDILLHGALLASSTMFSYTITHRLIPVVANHFLTKTKLHGIDMGKKDANKIPESLGIVVGLTYLASFLLFSVISPYILVSVNILNSYSLSDVFCSSSFSDGLGYSNSLSNLAAVTSIFAMLMLGFIDDCYDLRWRYKLFFPFAATIPLLSVYYYNYRDRTTILVPQFISRNLNLDEHLNIGLFYYIFMLMFVIFCTNAINIYAGINGLEAGQTIVLTVTIILYNLVEVTTNSDCDGFHVLSLQLLLPFLFCSAALYQYNRYPAKVFVGDSFCYFAGMTIAVVGILGHFSEEILIFATPQVFNFLLSVPQLFKILPCPRHRLPKFNGESGLREPSTFKFKYTNLNFLGRIVIKVYSALGFARLERVQEDASSDSDDAAANRESGDQFTSNNLTLINLWLCWFGAMDEKSLCYQLVRFQACLSFLALAVLTFIKMDLE